MAPIGRWCATPNVGNGANSLGGVMALAPDNVWAVGFSTASTKPPPGEYEVPTKTLIEHYDGTGWSVVTSPNVGPEQPVSIQPAVRCNRCLIDRYLGLWFVLRGQRQ